MNFDDLLTALTAHPLLEGDFRLTSGAEDRSEELSEIRFANTVVVPYLDARRAPAAVRSGAVVLWVRSPVAKKLLPDATERLGGRWLLLAARDAHLRVVSPRRAIGVLTVHSGQVTAPDPLPDPLPARLGHVIDTRVTTDGLVAEVDYLMEHHDEPYRTLPVLADPAAVGEHWHLREPAENARLLLDTLTGRR